MARLAKYYKETVLPELVKKFELKNIMEAPKLEKVVVNMGISPQKAEKTDFDTAKKELSIITGQAPMATHARKSISNFKLREGMHVGFVVTLRGEKMYEFIDRLFSITLPGIRDFRGLPDTSFDQFGNYSFGLKEQTVFPEIDIDKVKRTQGMNITFTFKNSEREKSRFILEKLGFPFKR